MKLNFEAPVRLTEALLPLLRATAPPPIAARPVADRQRLEHGGRGSPGPNARRLLGRQVRARRLERRAVRRGARTRRPRRAGAAGVRRDRGLSRPPSCSPTRCTRLIVSKPEAVAEAIVECGPGGKAERYVPRYYWLAAAARILAPGLVRRAIAGGAFTTATSHRPAATKLHRCN